MACAFGHHRSSPHALPVGRCRCRGWQHDPWITRWSGMLAVASPRAYAPCFSAPLSTETFGVRQAFGFAATLVSPLTRDWGPHRTALPTADGRSGPRTRSCAARGPVCFVRSSFACMACACRRRRVCGVGCLAHGVEQDCKGNHAASRSLTWGCAVSCSSRLPGTWRATKTSCSWGWNQGRGFPAFRGQGPITDPQQHGAALRQRLPDARHALARRMCARIHQAVAKVS